MRALLRITSSRAVIVPFTVPERRAESAVIAPSMQLASPCTSEAQTRSPTTAPSTWRSAEASMSPLMATSAPITEKVELATGRAGLRIGAEVCSGFFENMRGGLQEGARIDRAVVDAHFEMEVRAGRAAGAADLADDIARGHGLSDAGAPSGHVGVAGQHAIAMADFDDLSVTSLGSHESNRALGRGVDRRTDRAAKVEPGVHRRAAVERIAAIAEARRDHADVRRHDLRNAGQSAFERVHPREAHA